MNRGMQRAPKQLVTRRHAAAALTLAVALSVLALIPSGPATAADAKTSKLSPRLATLASDATFASPHLEAKALSLPTSGFGSLVTRPDGRVLVEIRTTDTSARGVAALRATGAQIVNVSAPYRTVTAAVAPSGLPRIAADSSVRYVTEVLAPHVDRLSAAQARAVTNAASPNVCAPIVSEGDTQMKADAARAANNVDGRGETVGILSDSFNAASGTATSWYTDVTNGELPGYGNPCGHPTDVAVQQEGSWFNGDVDEGRAMAQIVHDSAPGAHLAFSSIDYGELDFADQIDKLRTQHHATVLVDDAFYPNEPFFQDGPIANAARAATAAGVPYFSSAGNSNLTVGGNNVSSYESPAYRPSLCPVGANLGEVVLDCHDFDPTAGTGTSDSITVANGGGFALDLQWAEPRGAVATDLDLFVINSVGTVVAQSKTKSTAAGQPVEVLGWGNSTGSAQTVRIVIARYSGTATPRLKFVILDSDGITAVEYNTSGSGDIVGPSILGHSGASGIGSTAAIPYNDSTKSEAFSSHGPVTHYFQPTPSTAALGSPEIIDKPDFAATDGVRTSFFAQYIGGVWRFYGTSAAAPGAAAVGALLLSKDSLLTPADVMSTLHDTARSVANNGGADAVGGGYIDADAALASVTAHPGPPGLPTAQTRDHAALLSWGPPASDGGIPITGYAITPYKNGVAQQQQFFSTNPAAMAQGLTNGAAYTFRISALDANGAGALSIPTASINIGAPAAMTGPTVTAGGNAQATLQWEKPYANGSTITGYVIRPFRNGVAQPDRVVGTATTATITGLTNASPYFFEIAARSNRGNGVISAESRTVTIGVPDAPTNLILVPRNQSATLSWKAPSGNGAKIFSYQWSAYETNLTSSFEGGNVSASPAHIPSLQNGHTYRFRVEAVNSRGYGPLSALSGPVVAGAPTTPGTPKVVSGNGSVTLSWGASATNGAAITKYVVSAKVGGVAQAARNYPANQTSATLTGLKNGKTFSYTVAAINSRGSSPAAASISIVIGAPGTPTNVTAKTGKSKAVLSWTAPAANGAPISAYVVTPYRNGAARPAVTFKGSATTVTVVGLSSGDTYTFVVAAKNARGTGPRSAHTAAILVN